MPPPKDGGGDTTTTTADVADKMTSAAAVTSPPESSSNTSGDDSGGGSGDHHQPRNNQRGVSSTDSNTSESGAVIMMLGGGSGSGSGRIPLQPGEESYNNNNNNDGGGGPLYERPTSAPPGFIDQEPHQQQLAVDRTHMAEELIFGAYQQQQQQQQHFNASHPYSNQHAAAAAASQLHHQQHLHQQHQHQQQQVGVSSSQQSIYTASGYSHYTAGSNGSHGSGSHASYSMDPITGAVLFSSGGSAGSNTNNNSGGGGGPGGSGGTYSFSHLAAVLGTGLAESVEDATFMDRNHHQNVDAWFGGGDSTSAIAAANSSNINNISLHRHTRHAASRLIGNNSNPNHAEGGCGHHHAAAGVAASRPLSLYGAAPGNPMQHQHQQHQQQRLYGSSGGGGGSAVDDPATPPRGVVMMGGFPSSLSSPYGDAQNISSDHNDHNLENAQQQHVAVRGGGGGRSTTPIQMFPGQIASGGGGGGPGGTSGAGAGGGADHGPPHRRALPMTKDLGMNVSEPNDGESQFSGKILPGIVSQRMDHNNNSFDAADQQQHLHQHHHHADFNDPEESNYYGAAPSTLSGKSKEFTPSTFYGGGDNNNINNNVRSGGGGGGDAASTASDAVTEVSQRQCELELSPFLWDVTGVVVGVGGGAGGRGGHRRHEQPSRTIAILRASWLRAPEVRAACEAFGILETFRAEFSTRGIYLASFYDIRSAQYAAVELQASLQRLTIMNGGSEGVVVQYCIPLNSSSQFDESQILISDLPDEIDENSLAPMLASYGGVRSIISQGAGSFLIEFHNVQDARQAVLELDSSQPWGPGVQVEVAGRNPVERKRGRELLSIISRWRHGIGGRGGATASSAANSNSDPRFSATGYQERNNPASPASGLGQLEGFGVGGFGGGSGAAYPGGNNSVPRNAQPETQFILGPDGRYTQVLVQNPFSQQRGGQQQHFAQAIDLRQHQQQQVIQGPNGQIYITSVPMVPHQQVYQTLPGFPATVVTSAAYLDGGGGRRGGGATYYNHAVVSDNISVLSGRSHGTHGTHPSHHSSGGGGEDRDNRHLMLDLDAVENGRDSRTSLMVRNIPNKYTQQMLLSEFTENGHGPGVIDFFYLPIDFKNRCNRGYAFINFVDFKDILTFHRRYFGKHWRTFNSDKICDITYARIQGKAAMLKRFENSALMEKDDEYKPLVFVSEGPDKGKRLPFPADPATRTAAI